MILSEDLFDDVEIEVPAVVIDTPEVSTELPGPEQGPDTGIANELLTLINDESEAIQGYNNFKADTQGHEEFNELIDDISSEEMNHIGMLQAMLKAVSPNAETIDAGEEEAQADLGPTMSEVYGDDDLIAEKWTSHGYEDDLELALEDPGEFPDAEYYDEDADDSFMKKYSEE